MQQRGWLEFAFEAKTDIYEMDASPLGCRSFQIFNSSYIVFRVHFLFMRGLHSFDVLTWRFVVFKKCESVKHRPSSSQIDANGIQ